MVSLSLELAFGTEGLAKGVFLTTIYVIVFFLKWNKNIWRNKQSTMEQTVLQNHKHPKTIVFFQGSCFYSAVSSSSYASSCACWANCLYSHIFFYPQIIYHHNNSLFVLPRITQLPRFLLIERSFPSVEAIQFSQWQLSLSTTLVPMLRKHIQAQCGVPFYNQMINHIAVLL